MLDLNDLIRRNIPAITQALGAMLAEAASVCLESQGHVSGNVVLTVSGYVDKTYSLIWPRPLLRHSELIKLNGLLKMAQRELRFS